MQRKHLQDFLDNLLTPHQFNDYCPNGLQIEGSKVIEQIICGVSLSDQLINAAIKNYAQAIIVHHGILWNKAPLPITGIKYQRIAKLIKHDINLFAYHLPLDCHKEIGNNVQLANLLGIISEGQTLNQGLLWYGKFATPLSSSELVEKYHQLTGHVPCYFGNYKPIITKVAWCTGGADSFFEDAIKLGVDCFISGEASEPIKTLAEESAVAYLMGGHYVSERYGIMALNKQLKQANFNSEFIEIYNPL